MLRLLPYQLILMLIGCFSSVNAQIYNMPGGTISTCSGNFFDDGGSAGDHGSSDTTTTFCSNSGNCINVAFSTFNLISGLGFLKVYNGSSTGAPLIGSYTGTSLPNGGTITSATCCLTFEFTNGGSATVSSGWAAVITCVTCAVPTCVDGVQNGTETGVDCGGSCAVCPPPTIPTCNNYGTTGEDIFRSIIQTADGGYMMIGTAKIPPHPERKMLIVKIDDSLRVSWSKIIQTLDGDPTDLDGSGIGADAYQVVQTTDGGYAIAGGAYNTNNGLTHQAIVVKLDASGNLLWTQSYGSPVNDHFESIAKTTDGGFVCAGHTAGFGAGSDDFWIVKLTAAGAISWTSVVGTVGDDIARKVIQTSDGGYAVVGQSRRNGTGFPLQYPEIYVVKLTSAGAVSWTRHIEQSGEDYTGYSIYQTTDGGYAVAGRRNKSGAGGGNFFYVAKLTSGGSVSWTSAINDPSTSGFNFSNYHATSVIQNTAGNIVAAGRFTANFHYVVELNNTTGAIISTLKLPYQSVGAPSIPDNPAVIIQTADGGYAMGAAGARPISPFDNQFLFAKLSAVSVAGSCVACNTSTGGTRVSLGSNSSSGSSTTGGTTFPPTVAISSFTFPCVSSTCVTCAIPVPPPLGCCSAALNVNTSSTQAGCTVNNGTAIATATGGTGSYTYNWNTSPVQTNDTAIGLAAGTYTVTVSDAAGCVPAQTVAVTVPSANPLTVATTPAPTSCTACTGTATANPSGGTSYTYLWSAGGQTSQTATALCAGTYSVTVTDASGCTKMQTANVSQQVPNAVATATLYTISPDGSTQLTATGGGTYLWSPSAGLSCTTCPNPIATPSTTTTYSVTVTDASGCTATAFVTITVELPCVDIFIPNAFSPNQDGTNELECIMGNCIQTLHFAIYDRWGEKVFETTNPNDVCWDGFYKGKLMNTAVFVYYLRATLVSGDEIKKEGNITLIR